MHSHDPSGQLVFKLLKGLGRGGLGVAAISRRGGSGIVSTDDSVCGLPEKRTETKMRQCCYESAIGGADPCEKRSKVRAGPFRTKGGITVDGNHKCRGGETSPNLSEGHHN